MKWTNQYNLSDRVIRMIQGKYKERKPELNRLSITDLVDEPLPRVLYINHWDDIVRDYSDMLTMVQGIALHSRYEMCAGDDEDTEHKLEDVVDGVIVVGKADSYFDGTLLELKQTGVYGPKYRIPKWTKQMNCYDEETEVLTDMGWKFFKNLVGYEKIYSLNPKTNKTEYLFPDYYQKHNVQGYLLQYNSPTIDLKVTPDHNLYWKPTWKSSKYRLSPANKVKAKRIKFKKDGKFTGNKPPVFVFEGRDDIKKMPYKYSLPKTVCMTPFVAFMGWYLSEGCVVKHKKGRGYRINISQSPYSKHLSHLYKVLDLMRIKYSHSGHNIVFNDCRIYKYLEQFGKSKDKFIPDEIKGLNWKLLRVFLDSYCRGDGSKNGTGWQITTASKQMADDLQEIIFKAGYCSSILNGGQLQPGRNTYIVSLTKPKDFDYLSKSKRVFYIGWVYDVSLPKYHVMLVRRNGKAVWSGNCYAWQRRMRKEGVNELLVDIWYRDWKQGNVYWRDYPPIPYEYISLDLWSFEKQEQYIRSQVQKHLSYSVFDSPDQYTRPCSDEQRGIRFEAYKGKNKTPTKVGTYAEVNQWVSQQSIKFEVRKSSPVFCERYCRSRSICPFNKGE